MEFDIVIRDGQILDGSGSEPVAGDVGVRNGRIAAVGRVEGAAEQTIDADGAWITPGFIDIHTHYDGQATWDSRLQPSSLHGVTTVVLGNCGVGFAPVREPDRERLIELMEGVEDIPGSALAEGLEWQWETFLDYLALLAERRFDVDVGTQIAHGPLRVYVMGERGARREPASEEEIARMSQLVCEALEAGALGVSTSRTVAHRTGAGDLTPTFRAGDAELYGLARGVARAGTGVIELISDFIDTEEEFARIREMAALAGAPVSLSMIQVDPTPQRYRDLLRLISGAQRDGLPIYGQAFGRPVGVLMGLTATLHPFASHPGYREVADLPLPERVAVLRDPARKKRILAEEPVSPHLFVMFYGKRWDKMFPLGEPIDYAPAKSLSYAEQAARLGVTPAELVYDALLEEEGEALLYFPLHNYTDFDLGAVREMLTHEHCLFGLSDGGAHVASICDASISSYLLSFWCRDRAPGGALSPAWVIRKLTAEPAAYIGLSDRGMVAPGYRADLNVIAPDRLKLHRPKIVHDLPAGGGRFTQRADGYVATLVHGEVTYQHGETTGALPGRLIRGRRPAYRAAL